MKRSTLGATWVGALAAAGAALVFQGTAHAQSGQCTTNEDCGPGFRCNTETYEECWGGGGECDDEGNCTMTEPTCETVTRSWCAAAICATSSDCPSYMLCQPQSNWVCEGGMAGTGAGGSAGIGGTGGAGGAGGFECHEVPSDSLCVMKHMLPCEEASDCGGGFDCIPQVYWECSGGDGGGAGGTGGTSAAGAGGTAGMDVGGTGGVAGGIGGVGGGSGVGGDGDMGSCFPVESDVGYCSLQDLPCESDAQCFEGLRCAEQWIYPPCEPAEGGTSGSTAGMGGAGGALECPPPTIENRCVPLSYMGGGGTGGTGGVGGTGGIGGETGGMAGYGGAGGAGGGYAGEGGAAGMSSNPGGGNGGMGAAGTGAAGDDDGENDEHGHGNGHGRGRGLLKKLLRGCSAGGPVDGSASFGWLTLGLAAMVLRRRARRA